jgi:CRP/FNR family transcriptional regulator, cyclic AMP receptor protein
MEATAAQLSQIVVFSALQQADLVQLQPHTQLRAYLQGEIIMHEADQLPPCLYAIATGTIRITKTATTGKETILRVLSNGEIFAAPALLGDGIAPATVTAESDCQILTVEREALLNTIRHSPEIALSMLSVLNQRLQQLHNTVHGLVSERAIVRLVRYIQYCAAEQGTEETPQGIHLRMHLPYYQVARSIGITYEECVRLFKQLRSVLSYSRGGKVTVQSWQELEAIANGLD